MINRQKWCDKCGGFVESIYAGNPMFCRCAPKVDHINKLEADVAKLNHQLLKTENDLLQSQDINSLLDIEFRIACKRAEKAEAEAIQLKAQLNQALAIATQAHEEIGKFFRGIDYTRIGMEIYELKLTIK
jgi:hypothetical protein